MTVDLRLGNVLDVLRTMDAESVHCIVTSPPYWGLRAYGTEPQVWQNGHDLCVEHQWTDSTWKNGNASGGGRGLEYCKQSTNKGSFVADYHNRALPSNTCTRCGAWRGELGLEPTPELYVDHIVQIMREARRVLRGDGTLWLNIGDSFASGKGTCFNPGGGEHSLGKEHKDIHPLDRGNKSTLATSGLKPKDLVGIPWRVAFALQADGWYLRSDIIWHKPNPMPESVRDRPTKAHEYIFLMSKSPRYYYDAEAIREPNSPTSGKWGAANKNGKSDAVRAKEIKGEHGRTSALIRPMTQEEAHKYCENGRNKRSVWTVVTKSFSGAHFATFPPKLIEPCILAGCPKDGTVLDPFNGAGTTGLVALQHGRNYIGIDLKPEYLEMTRKRLDGVQMMTA